MECNMLTIGEPTGIDHASDRLTKWIFTGRKDRLQAVAKILLGWQQSM
jgi:hypothetical protein